MAKQSHLPKPNDQPKRRHLPFLVRDLRDPSKPAEKALRELERMMDEIPPPKESEDGQAAKAGDIEVREEDRSIRVGNRLFERLTSRQMDAAKLVIQAHRSGRPDILKDKILTEVGAAGWLGLFSSRPQFEGRPRRGCSPTAEGLKTALIVSGETPGTVRLNPRLFA